MKALKSELKINLHNVCVVFMDSKTYEVEIGVKNAHYGRKVSEEYLYLLDFSGN